MSDNRFHLFCADGWEKDFFRYVDSAFSWTEIRKILNDLEQSQLDNGRDINFNAKIMMNAPDGKLVITHELDRDPYPSRWIDLRS